MEEILLEIFGYFGTALVLLSFLMHDIKWLRIFNMSGGLISLIYAIIKVTMPVVVLNVSLIIINAFQLIRILMKEKADKAVQVADNQNEKEKEESI